VTSSWFFLSTLNYDARSTTHQICILLHLVRFLLTLNYDAWNHELKKNHVKCQGNYVARHVTSSYASFILSLFSITCYSITRQKGISFLNTESNAIRVSEKYIQRKENEKTNKGFPRLTVGKWTWNSQRVGLE